MTAPMPGLSANAVTRLTERLSHSWQRSASDAASQAPNRLPVIRPARPVGFPASIAEFLLVLRLRLRASRPASRSGDMLERAVRVVSVTCEDWFGTSELLKQHTHN